MSAAQTWRYAEMSDPAANPQFACLWCEPIRKHRPAARTAEVVSLAPPRPIRARHVRISPPVTARARAAIAAYRAALFLAAGGHAVAGAAP
jgi:hypothetical protein